VRLAVHNVGQLSDDDVRDRFVVRTPELEELLAHLREGDPPRHALVIGQRGMGKSLLLRRVALHVGEEPELAARWLTVMLPEELYEVTSIGELWLEALAQLAGALADTDLARQHQALAAEPDSKRMEALGLERLLGAARKRGRKVLLLAENLDMLLDHQVSPDQGWALRRALQTEPDLLLMATSVTGFAQVDEPSEALYGFFRRIDLRPLDVVDVRTLWRQVTGVDLIDDRAVPIRILTGGNPRLITVLGRFSRHPDLSRLREDLELLIDEYTPYFKANIEALPPVERKVFVTLADIWAPATAAEVAQRVRMTSNQVSALLARLVPRGAVEVVGDGRKKRYELTERLYNLYYLLRRPGGEGRVRALVDILTHLYDPRRLEREVLPGIARPFGAGGPVLTELDTRIVSRLERYIDEAGIWNDMLPAEHAARLPVFASLLESQRASLGDDHPDTLLTRQCVANATGGAGDDRAALDLYVRVAADSAELLGADHPDTLASRHQVAYYTGETADAVHALALSREVTTDCERVLGPDHRLTLTSRHNSAYYTGVCGDAGAAVDLLRQVAVGRERVQGPDHPETLSTRLALAFFTAETGDTRAALAIADVVARRAEALDLHGLRESARSLSMAFWLNALTSSDGPAPREVRELQQIRHRKD
jgi:DNA-binding MarR family transcriptional regulator